MSNEKTGRITIDFVPQENGVVNVDFDLEVISAKDKLLLELITEYLQHFVLVCIRKLKDVLDIHVMDITKVINDLWEVYEELIYHVEMNPLLDEIEHLSRILRRCIKELEDFEHNQ